MRCSFPIYYRMWFIYWTCFNDEHFTLTVAGVNMSVDRMASNLTMEGLPIIQVFSDNSTYDKGRLTTLFIVDVCSTSGNHLWTKLSWNK